MAKRSTPPLGSQLPHEMRVPPRADPLAWTAMDQRVGRSSNSPVRCPAPPRALSCRLASLHKQGQRRVRDGSVNNGGELAHAVCAVVMEEASSFATGVSCGFGLANFYK